MNMYRPHIRKALVVVSLIAALSGLVFCAGKYWQARSLISGSVHIAEQMRAFARTGLEQQSGAGTASNFFYKLASARSYNPGQELIADGRVAPGSMLERTPMLYDERRPSGSGVYLGHIKVIGQNVTLENLHYTIEPYVKSIDNLTCRFILGNLSGTNSLYSLVSVELTAKSAPKDCRPAGAHPMMDIICHDSYLRHDTFSKFPVPTSACGAVNRMVLTFK